MVLLAAEAGVTAELLTAYVAIATAAGTAFWAVTKHVSERRQNRLEQRAQAADQLAQRRVEESRARQQRAAELVKAVGEASDERARRWTMTALALYPDEALDLLLNSLGEASAADAAAIKLAVISVGPPALPRAVRAHRIAGQICRTTETEGAPEKVLTDQRQIDTATASAVRDCTREIILQLLFQLVEEERATVDLAYVDLSRVSLSGARLSRTNFRKTHLDCAVLVRASLNRSVLRGATLKGTVLRGARLRGADLTGAAGAVHAIGVDLTGATLDHADLAHSDLSAAHLKDSSLAGTNLQSANLSGAALGGATLDGARLLRATARQLKAPRLTARGVDLSHAAVERSLLQESAFEDCVLVRLDGSGVKADSTAFTRCNFGGAHLDKADLSKARFHDCNLGGVDLTSANLSETVFEACTVSSANLARAVLPGTRFERCRMSGALDFTAVDLSTVTLVDCELSESARFVVDDDSLTRVADPATRDVFERARAARPVDPARQSAAGGARPDGEDVGADRPSA